jgi:hypothetical protein
MTRAIICGTIALTALMLVAPAWREARALYACDAACVEIRSEDAR